MNGIPILVPQAVKAGWLEVLPGGLFDYSYPTSKNRRGRVQGGGRICPAIICGRGGTTAIYVIEWDEIDNERPDKAIWHGETDERGTDHTCDGLQITPTSD